MKIAVFGLGYVDLSNAVLLAQHDEVFAIEIAVARVEMLNARKSPIVDLELEDFLAIRSLNLMATVNSQRVLAGTNYVIVTTPTNYDAKTNKFDTASVEAVDQTTVTANLQATIVIKSTVLVGFVNDVRPRFGTDQVIFRPGFLREGKALYDNPHPSRTIVGERSERARIFANLLLNGAEEEDVETLSTDAKAIKLFADTCLAMRVVFFSELDSCAITEAKDTRQLVDGIDLDPRIGKHCNTPSFGYGGYCLLKETKQLLANFSEVPRKPSSRGRRRKSYPQGLLGKPGKRKELQQGYSFPLSTEGGF